MIRVFIVDDHPAVALGLSALLNKKRDLEVVGIAGSVAEAIAAIPEAEVDVVLQDLNLGKERGQQVMDTILRTTDSARFIIYTVFPEDAYALQLLRAGARGFLNKGAKLDEIVEAIRKVHHGGRYLSLELHYLEQELARGERVGLDRLSKREREVFDALVAGKRMVDIRTELGMSHGTLSTYAARMHRKLGTSSVADLARLAVATGRP